MNLEEALTQIAHDRNDEALQQQLKKSRASSPKKPEEPPKKPRYDFPTPHWSLAPQHHRAIDRLALLSAFDRPLGCRVLAPLVGSEAPQRFLIFWSVTQH